MKFAKTVLSTLSAAVLGLITLGLASAPVQATTASTTFSVTATVLATCSVSAGDMSFLNYTSTAASTSSSNVLVTCTTGTTYTLDLSKGSNGTDLTHRQMKSTSKTTTLNYGLYTDSGHGTNFGVLASATGTGSAVTIPVYGLVPANQYVTPATDYTDSITATVTY